MCYFSSNIWNLNSSILWNDLWPSMCYYHWFIIIVASLCIVFSSMTSVYFLKEEICWMSAEIFFFGLSLAICLLTVQCWFKASTSMFNIFISYSNHKSTCICILYFQINKLKKGGTCLVYHYKVYTSRLTTLLNLWFYTEIETIAFYLVLVYLMVKLLHKWGSH